MRLAQRLQARSVTRSNCIAANPRALRLAAGWLVSRRSSLAPSHRTEAILPSIQTQAAVMALVCPWSPRVRITHFARKIKPELPDSKSRAVARKVREGYDVAKPRARLVSGSPSACGPTAHAVQHVGQAFRGPPLGLLIHRWVPPTRPPYSGREAVQDLSAKFGQFFCARVAGYDGSAARELNPI